MFKPRQHLRQYSAKKKRPKARSCLTNHVAQFPLNFTPVTPLKHQLLNRIRQSGPMSFADFMAAALYDPLHGYYASGKARIGKEGDFTTSVSTGALFGRLLARQFSECWTMLGRPDE